LQSKLHENTPLHDATTSAIINRLYNAEANVNAQNEGDNTPFHRAVFAVDRRPDSLFRWIEAFVEKDAGPDGAN
jgi:ankyrin repeat protein